LMPVATYPAIFGCADAGSGILDGSHVP
jgi:hypothetical protein